MRLFAATRWIGVTLLAGTFVSLLPERESVTGTVSARADAAEKPSAEKSSKSKEQVKAKVFLSSDKLPAGGTCRFAVLLDVREGWHINANPPRPDNMIATTVTVKSKHKTTQLDTEYPEGEEFELEELPDALAVYEGEVLIRGTIEAAANTAGKTEELEFQIRYQACNDKNCLPPKTLKLAGKIEIVKPGTPVKQINRKYFEEKKH